jgi:hypothetical protein
VHCEYKMIRHLSIISMSYQLAKDDECDECEKYVKPIYNHDTWSCILCTLTEQSLGILWYRYQLPCGHHVHSRCYKKWCKLQKTVGCPSCGHRTMTKDNMYCEYCKWFGHPSTDHELTQ